VYKNIIIIYSKYFKTKTIVPNNNLCYRHCSYCVKLVYAILNYTYKINVIGSNLLLLYYIHLKNIVPYTFHGSLHTQLVLILLLSGATYLYIRSVDIKCLILNK